MYKKILSKSINISYLGVFYNILYNTLSVDIFIFYDHDKESTKKRPGDG